MTDDFKDDLDVGVAAAAGMAACFGDLPLAGSILGGIAIPRIGGAVIESAMGAGTLIKDWVYEGRMQEGVGRHR